jgi:hypothetical protein
MKDDFLQDSDAHPPLEPLDRPAAMGALGAVLTGAVVSGSLEPVPPVYEMDAAALSNALHSPDGFQQLSERFSHEVVSRRGLAELTGDLAFLEWLHTEAPLSAEAKSVALDAWFSSVGTAVDRKLEGYHALISEASGRATIRKANADRLRALAKTDESFVDNLKERLKLFFLERGLTRVDLANGRLRIHANGGKRPLRLLTTEALLPAEFTSEVTTYVVKDAELRAALDAGLAARAARVARVWAALNPGTDTHRITGDHRAATRLLEDFQAMMESDGVERPGAAVLLLRQARTPAELVAVLDQHDDLGLWGLVDTYFKPDPAEAILAYARYEEKGHHIRVE